MKKNATHRLGRAMPRARAQRDLSQLQIQLLHARAELADVKRELAESNEKPIVDVGTPDLSEVNGQLMIAVLNAHTAAELAELARRDVVSSSERRARNEVLAKNRLAEMNAELENRVSQRTRDLESARDEALAAVLAKEQFLSNMSHEIRTPMNGMLGALELLSETKLNPKQTHYIEVATTSGEALLAILNDVLDFAKMGSHRFQPDRAPIDVNAIARSVVALFSAAAERQAIDLQFSPDPALTGHRLGDALHLRQVLLNLVGNAMKFTPRGLVLLRTKLVSGGDGEHVVFEVQDTGIGIDPSQLQRIFEPFVQAEDSASAHPGGTGLGLSISRQLVATMGGELTVESAPGLGSTFQFRLALESAPETEPMPLDKLPQAPCAERLTDRVLLVEDNAVNRLIGAAMLESFGLEVILAENGLEALTKLADMSFAMVLMDCHMPVMDGYEATHRIREAELRKRLPRTPILALTANAFHSDVVRCLAAGMDAHLAKPYTAKQLRAAVTPWLVTIELSSANSPSVLHTFP